MSVIAISSLPPIDPRDPYFRTEVRKTSLLGEKEICLGKDNHGQKIWVSYKSISQFYKTISDQWLRVAISFERRHSYKFIHLQGLIDLGIPKEIIEKFKWKLSYLLELHRYYDENVKLIMEITDVDIYTFISFCNQRSITIVQLKLAQPDELRTLLSPFVLTKIYHDLKRIHFIEMELTEQEFLYWTQDSISYLSEWESISSTFPKVMSDEFRSILSEYNLKQSDLSLYFYFFPNQISPTLSKLQELKEQTDLPKKAKAIGAVRELVDAVATVKGLSLFYDEHLEPEQREEWEPSKFISIMTAADMSFKKLNGLKERGDLEEFLADLKENYADFQAIRKQNLTTIDFSRYLTYIDRGGFRELVKHHLAVINDKNCKGKLQLNDFLRETTTSWLSDKYRTFQNAVTEALFDEKLGAKKRWKSVKLANDTIIRTQQDDPKYLKRDDFAKIMVFAGNEIAKGTIRQVTRYPKEDTSLLRTVVINPKEDRKSFLLKDKGVPVPRSEGAFKSVSRRVVVEKDSSIRMCAELTQEIYDNYSVESWRKAYLHEFKLLEKLKDCFNIIRPVFDVHEYRSRKTGKLKVSAGQEWLDLPNFHYHGRILTFPLQSRFGLLIGIVHALKFLHSKDLTHNDLKTDNMGGRRTGITYTGVLSDFGSASKLGKRTHAGSHHYISPNYALERLLDKEHHSYRTTFQGDLWAFGLCILEVLLSASSQKARPRPQFWLDAARYDAELRKTEKDLPADEGFFQHLSKTKQVDIDSSIEKLQFIDVDGKAIPNKVQKDIQELSKILLREADPTEKEKPIDVLKEEALKLIDEVLARMNNIYREWPSKS